MGVNNDMVYTFDVNQGEERTASKYAKSVSSKADKYRLEGIIEQYSEQNKLLQQDLDKLVTQNSRLLGVEKNMNETLDMLKSKIGPKDVEYNTLVCKLVDAIESKEGNFFRMAFG